MLTDDMKGLFFVVKGQYKHHLEPQWRNPVTESVNWCGGYDPSSPSTAEWYMLFDWATLTCHRAGSDLDTVLGGVSASILKYRNKDTFVRTMRSMSFGVSSKSTKALDEHLGQLYGHHFAALVRAEEEKAYKVLRDQTPANLSRRLVRKREKTIEKVSTQETPLSTPPAVLTPRRRLTPIRRNIK